MTRLYIAGIAMTVFGRHLECETTNTDRCMDEKEIEARGTV
jgi:hypothetical protein